MGNSQAQQTVRNDWMIRNRHIRDSGGKLVFDDPILCAEFLRGYTNIEILQDVQPEDIEDISERFVSMWQEERNSDTVKKIRLKDTELFLIAIVEHQSRVYYDMSFKLLYYIVMILADYQKEQEKIIRGITKTKNFKYPPILPIVYYEGTGEWTAAKSFKERVHLSDALGEYIPDFKYLVVPITQYSNQELIDKQDELSLIFLINKLRNSDEFKNLKEIPQEYFENLRENTPEYLLTLISKIISVFLYQMQVPREEVEDFTDLIQRRKFDMLFESFEAYNVQETRRVSRDEGNRLHLISLIKKKCMKGKSIECIADEVEEDTSAIQKIYDIVKNNLEESDETILRMVK